MEIIVGKYSGFCNGVKYTINKTKEELSKNRNLYSLGEIVHNETVVNDLKNNGLIVKKSIDEIPDNSKVIIRAHGEMFSTYKRAKEKNLNIIDLTCSKVGLIHQIILKNKDDSYIIVIGKKDHPETIAHKSFSNNCYIVEDEEDINSCYLNYLTSGFNSIYIVSQTTFNEKKFNELVKVIQKVFKNVKVTVDNTICHITSIRQTEVAAIAKKVNKMIIIGGKNSSNTKELAIIADKYTPNVYMIQTYEDLQNILFNENDIVGIGAGASTPFEVVSDVIEYLNGIYKKTK